MSDLEKRLPDESLLEKNRFSVHNFFELEFRDEDSAAYRLRVRRESLNLYGIVHGGALYALADDACGTAAAGDGRFYVTQSGNLNFLRNQGTGTVRAEGRVRHRGRTTCLVEVDITGEGGVLLATGEFTYFRVDPELMEQQGRETAGAEEGAHA